jgi:hypothetical protein
MIMEPFVEKDNLPALLLLSPWTKNHAGLSAGMSTRRGGLSRGSWAELNCGLHVDDLPEHVLQNRKILARAAGFPFAAWTCAEQVHGSEVAVVTEADKGAGKDSLQTAIQGKDALVTNEAGIFLTALFADCVPLYFFDPHERVVGLAHAGWRGTVREIAGRMIAVMNSRFGCQPGNILAAIGPSIGGCCYEVDERVIREVGKLFPGHAEAGRETPPGVTRKENGRFLLDLKEINRQIMIKAGILPTHIEVSKWCTGCHPELFFSHRKQNGRTGRMVSWIGLEKR